MLIVISPAKTQDFQTPSPTTNHSLPLQLKETSTLIKTCKKLSQDEIKALMKCSDNIAALTHERFANWHDNFNIDNAKQAIFAFKGDVYDGLNSTDFTEQNLQFAQQHLRILSGLYGLLKPLDLIKPYRLEMGRALKNGDNKNLYQFWQKPLTALLSQSLNENEPLINLASNEYFKAINAKSLKSPIITPIFLDESKGDFKIISFYAKKARGLMSRHIIKNELNQVKDIQSFNLNGYQFDQMRSTDSDWVFKRSEKDAKQA